MDIILVPSTLTLTSRLFRLTSGGGGGTAEEELLQTNTEWNYSIPPLHRDEFAFQGALVDSTPPTLATPLPNFDNDPQNRGCFVRQLPGENPAFEVFFEALDRESIVNLTLMVGTFKNTYDVITEISLGAGKGGGMAGGGVTIYNELRPAVDLFFTISATNLNGLGASGGCRFVEGHFYDRSPPLARVNPIAEVSSHPTCVQALIVLFDEFGLAREGQELAVGRVRGREGADVLP